MQEKYKRAAKWGGLTLGTAAVLYGLVNGKDHEKTGSNRSSAYERVVEADPAPHKHLAKSTVKKLQRELTFFGYRGKIDGDFGPKTASVLKNFQNLRGIPETGEYDAKTKAELALLFRKGSFGTAPVEPASDIERNSIPLVHSKSRFVRDAGEIELGIADLIAEPFHDIVHTIAN